MSLYFERLNTQYAIVEFRQGGYGIVDRFGHDLHDSQANLINSTFNTPEAVLSYFELKVMQVTLYNQE